MMFAWETPKKKNEKRREKYEISRYLDMRDYDYGFTICEEFFFFVIFSIHQYHTIRVKMRKEYMAKIKRKKKLYK